MNEEIKNFKWRLIYGYFVVAVFTRDEEFNTTPWTHFKARWQWSNSLCVLSSTTLEEGGGCSQSLTLHMGRKYVIWGVSQSNDFICYVYTNTAIVYHYLHGNDFIIVSKPKPLFYMIVCVFGIFFGECLRGISHLNIMLTWMFLFVNGRHGTICEGLLIMLC